MRRADRFVVAILVAALAAVAIATALASPTANPLVAAPGETPATAAPGATPRPTEAVPVVYREGIVGRPMSVTPLTARGAVDRTLVGLVFSGLVRLGPAGSLEPDLAERWSVDEKGATWTFHLRSGARWHDGEPVTSADVVFTVAALQDPDYTGPVSTSWREVKAKAVDASTVTITLATPLGGFLQAMTQPLLPAHLLEGVPVAALADHPYAMAPVGSGPFRVTRLDGASATLVPWPAAFTSGIGGTSATGPSPAATSSPSPAASPVASPSASAPPARDGAAFDEIVISFYPDARSLADAYEMDFIEAAAGLSAREAVALAAEPDTRLLRYPSSTLTAVALNQRVGYPGRDELLRRTLVRVVDRDALAEKVVAGLAVRADGPIPPSSWAFDAAASAPLPFDRKGAAAALKKAGWRKDEAGWVPPKAKAPAVLQVVTLDAESNPFVAATTDEVVRYWTTFGFQVAVERLPAVEYAARLQSGEFSVAFVDVNVGLDPDLYPLFASTQATTTGTNISGMQNLALDAMLQTARAPGTDAARREAYAKVQEAFTKAQFMPPLFFRDEVVVVSDRVTGPAVRQVGGPGDRFWDVLTWRLAADR